ncbi:hypothetical protein Pelo_8128 [Pelomyxa schiedti]|nr:hypothetical protein Pelo_12184 [Pelomyxa schiedti]KAH3760052.1 hypothetical protein Pelo_8128 [Pelomyxa schiedti]
MQRLVVFVAFVVVVVHAALPDCPVHLSATLTNQLSEQLSISGYTLTDGKWESAPATTVSPYSDTTWAATDLCVGVEGSVTYKIGTTGYSIVCKFDLPEIGYNTCSVLINPVGSNYTATYSGCDSYKANILFVLSDY